MLLHMGARTNPIREMAGTRRFAKIGVDMNRRIKRPGALVHNMFLQVHSTPLLLKTYGGFTVVGLLDWRSRHTLENSEVTF